MGDDVRISPNCTIITGNYRFDRLDVPLREQGSSVSKGIRIGDRSGSAPTSQSRIHRRGRGELNSFDRMVSALARYLEPG